MLSVLITVRYYFLKQEGGGTHSPMSSMDCRKLPFCCYAGREYSFLFSLLKKYKQGRPYSTM